MTRPAPSIAKRCGSIRRTRPRTTTSAACTWQSGRLDAAIHEFSEVARLQPESAVGWKNLAAAYAMAGQFGRAVEAADTALSLKPDEPLASEIRGQREKYLARTRQP